METENKIKKLLGYLVEIQSSTAPIDLSIGYVNENNQVISDVIVIKECPPHIFDIVASWKEVNKEMIKGGLLIEVN